MKPGLVRLMAITSSAIGTLSKRSSSAVYLQQTSHETINLQTNLQTKCLIL